MDKTTFGSIAIGTKFVLPGGRRIFTKTTSRLAKADAINAVTLTFAKVQEVVPERDATVDDILGSWSKMS